MVQKECVILFSGGLDSRLVIKIMQEQGYKIIPLFFRLPFGCGCCNELECSFNFTQMQGFKLEIFDCTKGELFKEYFKIIKQAKYGRGSGVNPCKDCKLFMFKKAKEFADKKNIELIVTGDVLGERPMSQMRNSLKLIEEKSGLNGRVLRPLSAKLLPKTNAEKKGFINKNKLYDIQGRQRKKQIALAKKFKIHYPSPGGGCLLCEKFLIKRFKFLFKRGLNKEEIKIVNIGRHFLINNSWIVLGRNKQENNILEELKIGKIIVPNFIGPTAIILDKPNENILKKTNKLIKAYSKKGSLKQRKKFEEFKL